MAQLGLPLKRYVRRNTLIARVQMKLRSGKMLTTLYGSVVILQNLMMMS